MELSIRKEVPADYPEVEKVIRAAFRGDPSGDHTEHLLVKNLRSSKAFIPQLSLVAIIKGTIVGHILLSRIKIVDGHDEHNSLALAPVSVLPAFQHMGIGGQLIRRAHDEARDLGYLSVALIGHASYYPGFGYQKASSFGIYFPFEAPDECCMVVELKSGGLENVRGRVQYPEEFFL